MRLLGPRIASLWCVTTIRTLALLALIAAAPVSCGGGVQSGPDDASAQVASTSFRAPFTGKVARVWALGDGSVEGSSSVRRVSSLVTAAKPELFLYLGDVYSDGSAEDYRTYGSLYGSLAKRTAPTLGNHEADNRPSGYAAYWGRALGRPIPRWYSFKAGDWTIFSLDSEVDGSLARRQASWLRSKLKGRDTCRLAYWHRPRYSGGMHGDEPAVAPLWNALKGRARLVLNGHDHDMQELKRRDGITELVAGAGGNERYSLRSDGRRAWGNDDDFGALKLSLSRGRARYAFVDEGGRTLRRGSASCRPR